MWPGKGKFVKLCWKCYFRDPTSDKQMKMDGWMDYIHPRNLIASLHYLFHLNNLFLLAANMFPNNWLKSGEYSDYSKSLYLLLSEAKWCRNTSLRSEYTSTPLKWWWRWVSWHCMGQICLGLKGRLVCVSNTMSFLCDFFSTDERCEFPNSKSSVKGAT